ncbi:hypothetical protein CNR22_01650 [Sphingobacteriaceae bacterium]|nr:hypothetical protein CNR22_01650 [Sphingobacteriaceae bacterium]
MPLPDPYFSPGNTSVDFLTKINKAGDKDHFHLPFVGFTLYKNMNQQEHSSKTKTLVAGLLLGIIAGSILGIAFAPAKGRDTRRKLRDLFSELKDEHCEHSKKSEVKDEADPENDRPV